jgi:hypothetical protein
MILGLGVLLASIDEYYFKLLHLKIGNVEPIKVSFLFFPGTGILVPQT